MNVVVVVLAGAAALAGSAVSVMPPIAGRAPHINYVLHCQGCHLPDGSGMRGKVPDMRGMLGRLIMVPGGREYIAGVPGAANSSLDNADTAALLNWLIPQMGPRSTAFPPYTAAEVGRLRRSWLTDPLARRALLQARIGPPPGDGTPQRAD